MPSSLSTPGAALAFLLMGSVTASSTNLRAPGRDLEQVPTISEWTSVSKYADKLSNADWGGDGSVIASFETTFAGYPIEAANGEDEILVQFEEASVSDTGNPTCVILGRDSNDGSDWVWNVGGPWAGQDIDGSYYTISEKYTTNCRWQWGWVPWYTCDTEYRNVNVFDEGYGGFVKPFNYMSAALTTKINEKCKSATYFEYIGFSRGGALVQVAAMHHFRTELIKGASDVKMVLFNSPNALAQLSSDALASSLSSAINVQRYAKKKTWGITRTFKDEVTNLPPGYAKPVQNTLVDCPGAAEKSPVEMYVHKCGYYQEWK